MTKRRIIIVTSVIFGIFLIYNLVWFFSVGIKYMEYESKLAKVDAEGSSIKYSGEIDGYLYQIKPAGYLSFESGYLTVSKVDERMILMSGQGDEQRVFYRDDDGNKQYIDDWCSIDFYYWNNGLGELRYGIMYEDVTRFAQIILDNELNVLNGEDDGYKEEFQMVVDKNRDSIIELMNRAKEMWKLEY